MEKIMTAIVVSCLCVFALSFAPAPASAGPFDDVIGGFSDDGNDKPAATPHKGGGGGSGPKVADLEKRIKDLEDQAAKAPKPEAITTENLNGHLIPFYIVLGVAIVLAIIGGILAVDGHRLRTDVLGFKAEVERVEKKYDALGGALAALKKQVEKTPSTPPPPVPK